MDGEVPGSAGERTAGGTPTARRIVRRTADPAPAAAEHAAPTRRVVRRGARPSVPAPPEDGRLLAWGRDLAARTPGPVPWRRDDDPPHAAGAPHRLRDLDRTGRVVAIAVAVLLAVPFAVALVRLQRQGWIIGSDDALLGLRSLDVLGGDPPLIGQPTTSDVSGGGIRTHHPGPIQMWAFAPLVRGLGGWGMVVGAAVVNLAAVLTAVAVAHRRLGPAGGLVGAGLAALLLRSLGTSALTDPVSSNQWSVAVVAVGVLAWAVLDGDHRLLPLLAVWASWSAQQHLAAVIPTLTLVGVALVGVALAWRTRHDLAPLRWLGTAAAVALVLWMPVLVQQLTGDDPNLSAVASFAGADGRTTYGALDAIHFVVHAFLPVPVILRTDVFGWDLARDPGVPATAAVVVGLLLATALAALPGLDRRARRLVATGLVLLPVGVVATSNIPGNSTEVLRINLHRWIWPATTFVVVGSFWAVADLVVRRARADTTPAAHRPGVAGPLRGTWARAAASPAAVGVAVVALVVLAGTVPVGTDDGLRDPQTSQVSREVLDAVRDDMGDADTVVLVSAGLAADVLVLPAVTFGLERDGVDVGVPARLEPYFGDRAAGDEWDAAYVVASGVDDPPPVVGRVVADLIVDARLAATTAELARSLRDVAPTVNPVGDQLLSEVDTNVGLTARFALLEAGDDPVAALLNPVAVDLLVAGGVDGVDLDPRVLERHEALLDELRRTWLAERVVVLRVERSEVAGLLEAPSEPLPAARPEVGR